MSARHIITAVIILFILPASQQTSARAAEPLELTSTMSGIPLGRHMEILEDPAGSLNIRGAARATFYPSRENYPAFGLTRSAYWARFSVRNRGRSAVTWHLEAAYPHLDRIEVYRLDAKGGLIEKRAAGDLYPFASREMEHPNFVFSYIEEGESLHHYYVRVKTSSSMNLHFAAWSPEEFRRDDGRMKVLFGVYYGAMLVMVIYNLIIFFSLLDRSYLYYVLYCLAFIVFQLCMNGLAFQLLWPDFPWWANRSLFFWVLLAVIFAVQFLRYFLETSRYVPLLDRVLIANTLVLAAALPAPFFVGYRQMVVVSVALTMGTAMVLAVAAIRVLLLGNRAARLYIITWAAFWIGTIVFSMKLFSVMPDIVVTRWLLQVVSLVQMVLLSLCLADKINSMTGQLEALNLNLENKVHERTGELDSALMIMKMKEAELQKEFDLAGDIQQGMLPRTPFYHEGVRVKAYYRSMGKVGGDFYDIFHMKGGYTGVLIADASGHGMPAAFITALAKISFAEAIQTSLFPADIFRHVNDELVKAIRTDDFVTAFLVVISPTYDVFFCNASHQKALVYRRDSGTFATWDTRGLFMGYTQDANNMYEDGQSRLEYGDRLVLYTDGIVGCSGGSGETFGERRLERLIVETSSLPLDEAVERVSRACEEFGAGARQIDDMTLVMVEIDPAYRELIEYRDRGFQLMWRQRYRDAIGPLRRALEINANDEKSHLFIGECYLKNGDYEEAAGHLLKYLHNNEFDANVWYDLAWARFCLNDFAASLKYAIRANGLKVNFIDAQMLCGISMKKTGDRAGARRVFEKILAADPENEIAAKELREVEHE
ncbi:MAG: SpoIIE family protein phosphatase [Spirochaetes bacterium]|nr:SpoIIE family protein phosphatase [Spirochaetota bacterium]